MATSKTGVDEESRQKSTSKPFCRACTDFKSWMTHQRKPREETNTETKEKGHSMAVDDDIQNRRRMDCPLDKDSLGQNTWSFLHTIGATFPDKPSQKQSSEMKQFIHLFSQFYPCSPCAEEMRKTLKTLPPKTESRYELAQWFCELHNDVNRRLGKEEFDCKLVDERWKDGWKDGSCD